MKINVKQVKPGYSALRKGRVSITGQVYIVTSVVNNREKIFTDFNAACVASRIFEQNIIMGDSQMLTWVLMPDHVHWLLQLDEGDKLSILVNKLKSASARAVNHVLQRSGQIWMKGFHERALRQEDDLLAVARYIVVNPIRAGMVQRVGDYPFWNSVWL